ncbi:putative hydrolase [Trichoderma sp. SZMC 28013]
MLFSNTASLAVALFTGVATAASVPAWEDWAHGRVQLKNISMHFRYAGSGPPLLLVHGNPQHSITWRLLGPAMAEHYTVIAPDNRGMGDSSLAPNTDYTAASMASDLEGLLSFLNINKTFVFSYDKGVGAAVALAAKKPSLVQALAVSEYALPGFGYESLWTPQYNWDAYGNWELAWWSVPEAAERFIQGRVREVIGWFFYHTSYSGASSIPLSAVDEVVDSINKPGFLRSMLGPFAASTMGADAAFFNSTIRQHPLPMPFLGLGGEAGTAAILHELWPPVGTNVEVDIVPKAGHFPADENPNWVAQRINKFYNPYKQGISAVDLSWLTNKVTLV